MITNRYVKETLRNTLHDLKKCFLRESPITEDIKDVNNKPRSVLVKGREGTLGSHQQISLIICGGEIVRIGGN